MTSVPSFSATSSALSATGVGGGPTPDDAGVGVTGGIVSGTGEPPDCQLSTHRFAKRSLTSLTSQPQDQCKKRRKQSTPVRISNADQDGETSSDRQGTASPSATTSVTPPSTLRDHQAVADTYMSTVCPTSPVLAKMSPSRTTPPPPPPQQPLLDFSDRSSTPSIIQQQALLPQSPQGSVDLSANPVVDLRSSAVAILPPWMTEQSAMKLGDQPEWLPLPNMSTSAPLYMPHPELQTQVRNPNQPSIRIFNPEAYCELCNKEFCNKYFLKTHKANKHRIYSDPPVSDMNLINMPNFSTSTPTSTPTTPPHLKKNSITLNVDVMKNNDFNRTSSGTYSCEICNKIFSYKLLLKTHKKCIHGICEPDTDFETDNAERQMLKLDEQEPGQIEHSDEESMQKPNISLLFKNGMPPVDVSLVKEETYPEQEESPYSATNASKMSPASVSGQSRETSEQISNRLRRIGIMNPEAFCEICCKEYCNKYFLRTHKMKRHGILIPDDGLKDPTKPDSNMPNNWYQIQTSPLNLIMGEQNTNSSGSCSERKASPTNEHECEMCGLRFQTAQLAQLHASANCRGKPLELHETGHKTDGITINNNSNNHESFPSTINADTISEDLKKLQSMILQLNNLNETKTGPINNISIACNFCNKEFENKYILQAHVIAEHNMFPDENFEDKKDRESELVVEKMCCKICGRDGFTSIENFKQHKIECHNILMADASKEDSIDLNTSDGKVSNQERKFPAAISAERRSSVSLTPTSSYCEICNKELCNKYFMKTHMQRMHGIEIENGAQIGGVVCNICNKELCSKYFLRVHKHNTHGIVEEGATSNSGQSRPMAGELESIPTPTAIPQGEIATDNSLKPDLADLSHRYFSHFSEVCTICNRRFRSTKWLKAHLLGDHGKLGADKWNELELQLQQTFGQQNRTITFNKSSSSDRINSPMLKIPNGSSQSNADKEKSHSVQNVLSSLFGSDESNAKQYFCSYCSFSTPVLAFLFVHERSHTRPEQDSEQGNFQCVVCNQSFRQPELLQHHVLSQHHFLPIGQHFGGGIQKPLAIEQTNHHNLASQSPKIKTDGNGNDGGDEDDNDEQTPAVHLEAADQLQTRDQPSIVEQSCSRCKGKGTSFVGEDAGLSLKDVSNQSNLPATYALPQSAVIATKYVMQAFLMDEPPASGSEQAAECSGEEAGKSGVPLDPESAGQQREQQQHQIAAGNAERKFAPSIVFLPVRERLNTPLTVSFTLTPT